MKNIFTLLSLGMTFAASAAPLTQYLSTNDQIQIKKHLKDFNYHSTNAVHGSKAIRIQALQSLSNILSGNVVVKQNAPTLQILSLNQHQSLSRAQTLVSQAQKIEQQPDSIANRQNLKSISHELIAIYNQSSKAK